MSTTEKNSTLKFLAGIAKSDTRIENHLINLWQVLPDTDRKSIKMKHKHDKNLAKVLVWRVKNKNPTSDKQHRLQRISGRSRLNLELWKILVEFSTGRKKKWTSTAITFVAEPQFPLSLTLLHESQCVVPSGIKKSYHKVQEQIFWSGMKRYVWNWVDSGCHCRRRKRTPQKRRRSMTTCKLSHPFWWVSSNLLWPSLVSEGCKYILCIGDQFS